MSQPDQNEADVLSLDSLAIENARYEIKMICQEWSKERIAHELRLHPEAMRRIHPTRRVQSIYLDSHEGLALDQNLAGISEREKFRFRWYGESGPSVVGVLECKIRRNLLGWKQTLPIPQTMHLEGMGRNDFMAALRQSATPSWRSQLDNGLEVAQWISYEREYYQTAEGSVRVTVDSNLECFDQRFRASLSRGVRTHLEKTMIVEVKSDARAFDRLREVMNNFPLVVDKCSKFVMASDPASAPTVSVLPM